MSEKKLIKLNKNDMKRQKELAELILLHNNTDYDEWLHEQHTKIVNDNFSTLVDAMKSVL